MTVTRSRLVAWLLLAFVAGMCVDAVWCLSSHLTHGRDSGNGDQIQGVSE